MLWLNPLLLVEGFGQLHPDLLGVVLLTAGLLASPSLPGHRRGDGLGPGDAVQAELGPDRSPGSGWSGTGAWARRATRAGLLALCLLAAAAVVYAPFWRGPETLAVSCAG